MKYYISIILLLSSLAWSRTPVDNYYFAGGLMGINNRFGRIELGDDKLTDVDINPLRSFGLVFGRNVPLPFHLRLAVEAHLETGSVEDGRFEDVLLDNGTTPDLLFISRMYHAGIQPMLHIPLRKTASAWPFVAVGPGVHYVFFKEELKPDDDQNIRVEDSYIEEGKRFCFSVSGGGGFEFTISPRMAVRLSYLFKLWKPVERLTARDLFPLDKKTYYEIFHTHLFYITVNVPSVSP